MIHLYYRPDLTCVRWYSPHDEAPELVNPFLLEFLETKTPKQNPMNLQSIFGGMF
jgi:hypothetical protein